jgi:hypothetical protein
MKMQLSTLFPMGRTPLHIAKGISLILDILFLKALTSERVVDDQTQTENLLFKFNLAWLNIQKWK